MTDHIRQYFEQSAKVLSDTAERTSFIYQIERAVDQLVFAIKNGNKIFAVGNGGSACDASHFISELVGKYRKPRDPIAAISLTDAASVTCISNDFGYEDIYARQIIALGKKGDVLLALSTSGTSQNVIAAMEAALMKGMLVIGICGEGAPDIFVQPAQVLVVVKSRLTNHIQEMTIKIIHVLVELIEKELYGRDE